MTLHPVNAELRIFNAMGGSGVLSCLFNSLLSAFMVKAMYLQSIKFAAVGGSPCSMFLGLNVVPGCDF